MSYNLHPILVHFPIALLFLYSLIKICPVNTWFPKLIWKPIEKFLLLAGTVGVFLAKSSGEIAKHLTQPSKGIVEMHEVFANITTWLYVALVVIEFLPVVIKFLRKKIKGLEKIFEILYKISILIDKKWVIVLLSILGLIALFLTGLLGGVMVYGLEADPLAPFVLSIFGL